MNNPVKIDDFDPWEGSYTDRDKKYAFRDLLKAAENLPVFDLPLQGVWLDHKITHETLWSFIYHYKRVEKADLSYPILLDDRGYICDGWHRVAKAILEGRTTIKAKRLLFMPESL